MKTKLIKAIRSTDFGNRCLAVIKWLLRKEVHIDYDFPKLINIEIASICNLRCIHCPSHSINSDVTVRRTFGIMSFIVFNNIMNEIDAEGCRSISLHKDGEPLLNKEIIVILDRVKLKVNHDVYLTTNGLLLNDDICKAIIRNNINRVNISIGADSNEMYKRIRGGDIHIVKSNVAKLIQMIQSSNSKCLVSVQIINLENIDMTNEIKSFYKYWKDKSVNIEVWKELSWGIKALSMGRLNRYPCLSLWNSFNINADGKVSACCMDWNQSLIIGEYGSNSIKEIWNNEQIKNYRLNHTQNIFDSMDLCNKCNYWQWQPMIMKYKTLA